MKLNTCIMFASYKVPTNKIQHTIQIYTWAGRRLIIIIIGSINKQSEYFQLDDVTFNWKLMGIRLSQIITELRYKPSEVIQLPSLLTMWGSLGKKFSKKRVRELKL